MKRREWILLIILSITVMASVLIGVGQVYITGPEGVRLKAVQTLWLFFETAALFCVSFFIIRTAQTKWLRFLLLSFMTMGFLWIHQVFLPVLVSGAYLAAVIRCGSALRRLLDRHRRLPEYHGVTCMADLTLGCGLLITVFCLMSLAGIGSIENTRLAVLVLLALSFFPAVSGSEARARARAGYGGFWRERKPMTVGVSLCLAFFFAMVFLQAGRMNICADYDSLHYGLRSEYILNDGGGIYEDLGSVNVVYTYSKGLEILLLPISGLPSYSFFLSAQLWMTVGLLLTAGKTAGLFVNRRHGLLCLALLASVPGIMNMSVTAKTDSATALFQLIMIYFLLLYIRRQKTYWLVLAGNAFFMTMVLKPTALVFSTIVGGTAFLCMVFMKRLRIQWKEPFFLGWIPMLSMWALVWLRTWLLTGLPVTSVFYSIWNKLGFVVRYPFRFDDLPSNGGSLFSISGVKHFFKRLYGVLLAPVGEDMAHVWIAWGTPILLIFLVLFLVVLLARTRRFRKTEEKPFYCLVWMFLACGAASLAALYLLWQVDGNYFILLYALFGILAAVAIGKLESRFLARSVVKLLIPAVLFNVTVTGVSNWKGALGLSPVKLVHKGYFDHWQQEKENMALKGNGKIWEILEADSETRVLVFGQQPEMLMFPCNTQSYTDVEGSGGNFYISASPEAMVSFMDHAGTDYVYLGSGFLRPGTEGWRNVTAMIQRGYVTDVFYENGNGLGRFTADPALEKAEEELADFVAKYWPGEQQ